MDPQSTAFQPQSNDWRLRDELSRLQVVQAEHSERLSRIERRVEDDARMKSVWGGASPFPGVLSGTPQQTPLHQPSADAFKNFDDESANLIGSLHLDAEEEPRRIGATSRANSVRFDESANQGHWSHTSRSSMDLMRSAAGLPMAERTSSHKSDGRASSVHSIRSAASGRANSLNLDTGYSFGDSNRSPVETPGLAPGLLLLGSVPAIIRCWMNTNFKHDALLYAAVCTGSHRSFVDRRLVDKLGFGSRISISGNGGQTVMLPVYFPEAVPHPASSRSSSPAPQLPTLTVTFAVTSPPAFENADQKSIQIILGADTLRIHNADVMFSSSTLSLFDDDRNKVSIPLVRPEDEQTFINLRTTGGSTQASKAPSESDTRPLPASINGLKQSDQTSSDSETPFVTNAPIGTPKAPATVSSESTTIRPGADAGSDDEDDRPTGRSIRFARDVSTSASPKPESRDSREDDRPPVSPPPSTTNPAVWSNWRQRGPDATATNTMDYANAGRSREPVQRKESGMKVLRPMKSGTRTFSATSTSASSPNLDGRSRFFDDGRRRVTLGSPSIDQKREANPAADTNAKVQVGQAQAGASGDKARANPAGGASAFSWLKQGGAK